MADSNLNPFLLAANTPTPDPRLLPLLRSKPALAAKQDGHGYSLLHAAASYNHVELLRTLVNEFKVDVNLKDEDNETCLYVAETVEIAKCLVEELEIDVESQSDEGMTAVEKIAAEGDFPDVVAYIQQTQSHTRTSGVSAASAVNGIGHPPPVPPNMNISINTATEDQLNGVEGQEPDPEFRRRIEELAARENFNTEEGQRDLRTLITDAVRGVSSNDRDVRQRVN